MKDNTKILRIPEQTTISRWGFLQKLAVGILGAMLMFSGGTYNANAWVNEETDTPMLAELCDSNPTLYLTFMDMSLGNNFYTAKEIKDNLDYRVKKNTHLERPAFWFIADYHNKVSNYRRGGDIDIYKVKKSKVKDLDKDPKMKAWRYASKDFFDAFIHTNHMYDHVNLKRFKKAEESCAKALVLSAGRKESEWKDLINAINNKSKPYLNGIINSIKKQNKRDKLIASWSSYLLSQSRWGIEGIDGNRGYFELSVLNLEYPLIERDATIRIRGNPRDLETYYRGRSPFKK